MNPDEIEKYRKELSLAVKKILSSKEKTMKFLVDAGINTPSGKLTKRYSGGNPSQK